MHKASIRVAVINAASKLLMESVAETSAATVLDLLKGLRGRNWPGVTVARKIAAVTLAVWKCGGCFVDPSAQRRSHTWEDSF